MTRLPFSPSTVLFCWIHAMGAMPIAVASEPAPRELGGLWHGALTCPGGDIWFGLDFVSGKCMLLNGPERIEVPVTTYRDGKLKLDFPHYDSSLSAEFNGNHFIGAWTKTRGKGNRSQLTFTMRPANERLAAGPFSPFAGKWQVTFSSAAEPAVGIFQTTNGVSWGTFLTSTGDYRYLSARVLDDQLSLSVFDGAHAFLFRAQLNGEELQGDFWSGDHWHETWTGRRDEGAKLASGLSGAESVAVVDFSDLRFRNLKGDLVVVPSAQRQGKVVLLELFGTWCPNCHDAAHWLGQLDQEYSNDDLSIVGLAFELTGDVDRDIRQVQRYIERFDVKYPVYVAGLADKQVASAQFPLLDRVRAYPTTIFMDRQGSIRAVYHGFTGPATGEDYERLKQTFRQIIDKIISEA